MKSFFRGIAATAALLLVVLSLAPVKVQAGLVQDAGAQYDIRIEPPEHGFADIGSFVNNLARFIFILAIVLVFVYFLWGGIRWITSGGDKAQTENARNVLTAALLGFAVIALAYALVRLIGSFFGIDIFGGFRIPTPPPAVSIAQCTNLGAAACTTGGGGNCTTANYFCYSEGGNNYCCPPAAKQ